MTIVLMTASIIVVMMASMIVSVIVIGGVDVVDDCVDDGV